MCLFLLDKKIAYKANSWSSSRLANSKVEMWVAFKFTLGANPAS
jgi:hypothetical protein